MNSLNVGISGSLKAQLYVGIAAELEYNKKNEKKIIEQAIPYAGFSSKVLTVGAVASLYATTELNLEAKGQLLVGGAMEFEAYKASYDFKTSQKTIDGFTPKFTKKFEAQGEVQVTATLGLPVEIAVKLEITRASPPCSRLHC